MTRWVSVTQADIAHGQRRTPDACPVALAATRAFQQPMRVGGFAIGPRAGRQVGQLPDRIADWIARFDGHRGREAVVKPTRFKCVIT